MTATPFEIKAYPEMWGELDMDVPRFDKARLMLGEMYQKTYLSQAKRPSAMAYFDNMIAEIHGGRIKELLAAKAEGRPVIGTFCVYIPEEIVLAAGGICVGLCGGSQGSVPDAEKILPRNICPMVKSAFGFKAGRICPYFQVVDFVYGETTCDAKKKTWEILDTMVPTYVMEIPQLKRQRDIDLWLAEVKDFKTKVEEVAGKTITETDLASAITVMNNKRKALQRLNSLRHHNPTPISGKDGLLIEQIAFYDEPVRFTEKVNALCDELEERIKNGVAVPTENATQGDGGRYSHGPAQLEDPQSGGGRGCGDRQRGVVHRHPLFQGSHRRELPPTWTACSPRSPTVTRRSTAPASPPTTSGSTQVIKEFRDSKAQGIINYSLQFCHTYNIEEIRIRQACEREGIPYLFIESDYSAEDIGQLQTRIEAFLEQIGE